MKSLHYFLAACLALVILAYSPLKSNSLHGYKIGDCLVLKGKEDIYKVTEVGKYGLKTNKPHYDEFRETLLFPEDLNNSDHMDCFDMFDVKDNK